MADERKPPLKVKLTPESVADLEEIEDFDAEIADVMRAFMDALREAADGVNSGKYASFEDGVEELTGCRPTLVEVENPDDLDEDDDSLDTQPTKH